MASSALSLPGLAPCARFQRLLCGGLQASLKVRAGGPRTSLLGFSSLHCNFRRWVVKEMPLNPKPYGLLLIRISRAVLVL